MTAMKRPRVQTKKKMSNSVSETCDPPIPPPSFPPRVVCERALTLFKAVIIKSPARKPHPPSEQPNSFVTRKYCENRDEVEESGENRERGGRLSFSKLSLGEAEAEEASLFCEDSSESRGTMHPFFSHRSALASCNASRGDEDGGRQMGFTQTFASGISHKDWLYELM